MDPGALNGDNNGKIVYYSRPADIAKSLIETIGMEKTLQLIRLLDKVINDTGYGDVKIVIADGKVQMLKAEYSYK